MKRDAEKGSALLVVFLMAAIVAITLYMEMPVTVFEAKRQKEQITINDGKEYAHAVKLFVRKIGRYPSSLDELQNTNNMRFLRHKFKDPFTGDDDWRLLHAGPGGVILDSKVKPAATSTFTGNTPAAGFGSNNGTSNSTNSGSNANSNSTSSASNTNTGSGQPDFPMAGSIAAEATAAVQPAAPKRPPAVAANGSKTTDPNSSDQSSWQSLVPPIPGDQNDISGQASANSNPGGIANPGMTGQGNAGAVSAGPNGTNGQPGNLSTPQGQQGTAANMQNTVNQMSGSGGQTIGSGAANTPGSTTGTSGTMTAGGGIAGVAVPDKVAGLGIKAVNDQHKYQLWEFYYDPTQDTLGTSGAGQTPQGGTNQNPTGTGTTGTSAFGSNNGSVFGSNGNSTTSFGSPSTSSNSGATPQSNPQ
jgi:hypothetical protein